MSLCSMLQDSIIESQEFVNGKRHVYVIVNNSNDDIVDIFSTQEKAQEVVNRFEEENHPAYNCYLVVKWEVR